MTKAKPRGVAPIDPEVREVLRELSESPIALASEIVNLRAELAAIRRERPHPEVILPPPQAPRDTPPPTRLES